MDELCLNYANALYGLLTPKQREDALKALSSVCLDLEGEAAFARLLASYNLTSEEKRGVIDKVYGAKFNDIPHFHFTRCVVIGLVCGNSISVYFFLFFINFIIQNMF